jgi:uncharacterized protein (TIGR03083 family)
VTEPLSHDWYIDRALEEIDRLAWVADGADPADIVPTCPGWTMAKLVKHTGMIHRWATEIVSSRSSDRVDIRSLDLGLPGKESDYSGWLADGGEPLAQALREAGPSAPVWAWGAEHTTGWWARRMLHESTMHRADAEIADGEPPRIDPVTAADGIDEFLANLPTAARPKDHLSALPAGQSLHLHATGPVIGGGLTGGEVTDHASGGGLTGGGATGDGVTGDRGSDGEWLIRFTGEGIEWERGHAKATTAVRAPVDALLLFTYGRIRASDERFTVFGPESVLAAWQEKTAL